MHRFLYGMSTYHRLVGKVLLADTIAGPLPPRGLDHGLVGKVLTRHVPNAIQMR